MGLLSRLSAENQSNGETMNGSAADGQRPRRSTIDLSRPDRFDPFLADVELRSAYRAQVDGDITPLERFLEMSSKSWMFGPIITGDIVGLEPVAFERWVDFKCSPRSRVLYAQIQIRDAFAARRRDLDLRADGLVVPAGGQQGEDEGGMPLAVDGLLRQADELFVTRLSAAEEIVVRVR